MQNQDPQMPHGASGDLIEIRDGDAITIEEALIIAAGLTYSIGKSTLQRWAKYWRENPNTPGAVRSIKVTVPSGTTYKISRQDFEAWIFDRQQDEKPREAPQDLQRSHEASRDLERPRETLRDLGRSRETSRENYQAEQRIQELEEKNMSLTIDIKVRDGLLIEAKRQIEEARSFANDKLKEIGRLEYQMEQVKQLGAGPAQSDQSQPNSSFSQTVETQ